MVLPFYISFVSSGVEEAPCTLKILLHSYRSSAGKRIFAKKRQSSMTRVLHSSNCLSLVDPNSQTNVPSIHRRSLAYQFKSHIGLITFSTEARIYRIIVDMIEDFRNSVRHTACHGDTALWDALALARDNFRKSSCYLPNLLDTTPESSSDSPKSAMRMHRSSRPLPPSKSLGTFSIRS